MTRSFAARRMNPLAVSLAPNLPRNDPSVGLATLLFRCALNHLVPRSHEPWKLAVVG